MAVAGRFKVIVVPEAPLKYAKLGILGPVICWPMGSDAVELAQFSVTLADVVEQDKTMSDVETRGLIIKSLV